MAFSITISEDAEIQMRGLSARQQRALQAAILARLQDRPTTPTRAIKRLRPNPLAEFELRVGDLRVLYNVEGSEVILLVVGEKVGNKLLTTALETKLDRNRLSRILRLDRIWKFSFQRSCQ